MDKYTQEYINDYYEFRCYSYNNMEINVDLIRDYLHKNKITKGEFCEMCNINQRTLNKVLNKQYSFKYEVLLKIAKAMSTGLQQLFIFYHY